MANNQTATIGLEATGCVESNSGGGLLLQAIVDSRLRYSTVCGLMVVLPLEQNLGDGGLWFWHICTDHGGALGIEPRLC